MHRVSDLGVEAVKFSSWPDMIEALKGGELHGAFILAPIAMAMIEQGVPLKVALLGHRDGTALVAGLDSGIDDVSMLSGRTIAIPIRYSNQNIALLRILNDANVVVNEKKIVEMPPPDMPSALSSGAIDAYIVGEPYAAWSEIAGSGKILVQMKDFWPGFISSVLVMREDVIHARQKQVNSFVRDINEQGQWVEAHRVEAADICADFFGLSRSLIRYVLTQPPDRVSYTNLLPVDSEFDEIGRYMVKYGLISDVPAGKDIIYTEWQ
jgi:NitT/TauT family transport system substrate-binding protein